MPPVQRTTEEFASETVSHQNWRAAKLAALELVEALQACSAACRSEFAEQVKRSVALGAALGEDKAK